ncbi:MAG: hypothetical protein H0V56_04305 [Chthoniobacterales bacterium]|nr:hypothetical protein [Chthoniobacterales bacterium]
MTLRELIGSYFNISNLPVICPWCSQKELTLSGEIWRCEACKRSGDAVDWVMQYEHVGRDRALEMLSLPDSPDRNWEEFEGMFRRACRDWGYTPIELDRKALEPPKPGR